MTRLKLFSHILPFQVALLQAIMKWQNISITDPVVSVCFLHFLDFGKGFYLEGESCTLAISLMFFNCPALAFEIEPASFAILQQIRNSTGLKCKTHMTTCVLSKASNSNALAVHTLSIVPHPWLKGRTHDLPSWVCSSHCRFAIDVLDAAVQTQNITNHIVKNLVLLMVQSSLFVFGHFLVFGHVRSQQWPTRVKMLMEGNEGTS